MDHFTPYSRSSALIAARARLEDDSYEHVVSTWGCTMVKQAFSASNWMMTPERRDSHSGKKPDLVIERVEDGIPIPHLIMEFKSPTGDSIMQAVRQTVAEIAETMEEVIEAYVVVMRGKKIAFFEYHNDRTNLDEERIPNLLGCVSLTQGYFIQGVHQDIIPGLFIPDGVQTMQMRSQRTIARRYGESEDNLITEPCIFDIDMHQSHIDLIFHHMANQPPRSSV